jgi:hypothetical protein
MSDTRVTYRHTQVGWAILVALAAALAVLTFAAGRAGWGTPAYAVLGLIAVVGVLFCTLTVSVGGGEIAWRFGVGLIRRRVLLVEARGVQPARTRLVDGWGVRYTMQGWLYNVSGFDAVALELTDGSFLRIGTDEPEALAAAIRAALAKR